MQHQQVSALRVVAEARALLAGDGGQAGFAGEGLVFGGAEGEAGWGGAAGCGGGHFSLVVGGDVVCLFFSFLSGVRLGCLWEEAVGMCVLLSRGGGVWFLLVVLLSLSVVGSLSGLFCVWLV